MALNQQYSTADMIMLLMIRNRGPEFKSVLIPDCYLILYFHHGTSNPSHLLVNGSIIIVIMLSLRRIQNKVR